MAGGGRGRFIGVAPGAVASGGASGGFFVEVEGFQHAATEIHSPWAVDFVQAANLAIGGFSEVICIAKKANGTEGRDYIGDAVCEIC